MASGADCDVVFGGSERDSGVVTTSGFAADRVDSLDDGLAGEGIHQRQHLDGAEVDLEEARSPVQLALLLETDDLACERLLRKAVSPLTRTHPIRVTGRVSQSGG